MAQKPDAYLRMVQGEWRALCSRTHKKIASAQLWTECARLAQEAGYRLTVEGDEG